MTIETTPAADPGRWLRSVRRSHDRLADQILALEPSELGRLSYCAEWSVADVLSHLGSQAEIFSLFVDAGLEGGDAPAQSAFAPIWDSWNNRTPEVQATDSIAANERLVARLEAVDPAQLASFRLEIFGMDLDAAGLLRMRLSEHAVHTWDVVVAFDEKAVVAPDAVALLIDGLPEMAARISKPAGQPTAITVRTSAPDRRFVLDRDGVRLEPQADAADDASLELPAEALLRLVYGRLDPSHLEADPDSPGVTVEDLRAVFPGF